MNAEQVFLGVADEMLKNLVIHSAIFEVSMSVGSSSKLHSFMSLIELKFTLTMASVSWYEHRGFFTLLSAGAVS